jgi:SAM-dependent methyltransferase
VTTATAKPPALDLEYAIEDDIPPGPYPPDSAYVFRRMPKLITDKATEGAVGRVLDVGCGFGGQMALLRERGWEAWGLDASFELARYCRDRFAGERPAVAVCAIAEELPFRDGAFDTVVCQGSLDHFARPRAFLREVARVLRPDGRAVIAIANYDSLSCRLGRGLFELKERFGAPVFHGRNFWQIPPNHTFKGTYHALLGMGAPHLELVECRGISLLWLFHRWTRLLEALPPSLSWSLLTVLDGIAYRAPAIADVLVSVWRPQSPHGKG